MMLIVGGKGLCVGGGDDRAGERALGESWVLLSAFCSSGGAAGAAGLSCLVARPVLLRRGMGGA